MTKSTAFSQTRIQIHLNTIFKKANGARVFMGNFLCGAKRVKRFVKVHLHSIVRNLKKDKRNIDVAPPLEKFLRTPMVCGAHPIKLIATCLVSGRAIKRKLQKWIEK